MEFVVYCDGASRKDGRGGWGASIRGVGERAADYDADLFGGEYETTNNRMELMAVIETLWYLPAHSTIKIVCDSKYVLDGASDYVETWQRAGWRTSTNKPVKNVDLWKELVAACTSQTIEWAWVKGHTGVEGNERADRLAAMGVPPEGDGENHPNAAARKRDGSRGQERNCSDRQR